MRLHETCTTDQAAPRFDHEWQRRAFGLAVALSEFGHYKWDDFQQSLIQTISRWENPPESQRGDWQYYERTGPRGPHVEAERRPPHRHGVQADRLPSALR